MISPSDADYVETKLVKLGQCNSAPVFKELADWIEGYTRGIRVLNICYDKNSRSSHLGLPRLNVILDCDDDKERFLTPDGNFDPTAAAIIAKQFKKILAHNRDNSFDTNRLFVIFSAFEPVAKVEANWRVTEEQIVQLQKSLNCPAIWTIRPNWETVTFFFYTAVQLQASTNSVFRRTCVEAYSKMLFPYDEFGYFQRRPIEASFDSKENFEKAYGGNWFNYDR